MAFIVSSSSTVCEQITKGPPRWNMVSMNRYLVLFLSACAFVLAQDNHKPNEKPKESIVVLDSKVDSLQRELTSQQALVEKRLDVQQESINRRFADLSSHSSTCIGSSVLSEVLERSLRSCLGERIRTKESSTKLECRKWIRYTETVTKKSGGLTNLACANWMRASERTTCESASSTKAALATLTIRRHPN
jgi:hypothetical protein